MKDQGAGYAARYQATRSFALPSSEVNCPTEYWYKIRLGYAMPVMEKLELVF